MEEVLIITGGSKGVGKGIVAAYLSNGARIFSISRTVNKELSIAGVTQIQLDLTQTDKIKETATQIFNLLDAAKIAKITLINNAGTLGQIGPLGKLESHTILHAIGLNIAVPLIFSSIFLENTKGWKARKTVINISSGAALKPYHGWSIYCSTKAALNMLTQTLAVEQADVVNGVKALAIAPGVVDTEMQAEIRASNKEDFKAIERFVALKKDGALNNVTTVGMKIYEIDHEEGIATGSVLRVE